MKVMYNDDYMERKRRESTRMRGISSCPWTVSVPLPSFSKVESGVDTAVAVAIQPMSIVIHIVI